MKATVNWKARQKAFHSTHSVFDDSTENHQIQILDTDAQIVAKAVEYFIKDTEVLYYPSKSYSVAIIYSYLLNKEFGVNLMEALNDPDLLYNNDPFFKPYSESIHVYDQIIIQLPRFFINSTTKNVGKTIKCFYEEFGLAYST